MPHPNPPVPNTRLAGSNLAVRGLYVPSVRFAVYTTRPTTGLVKGDVFIAFHNSVPNICVCISTAGQTVKQIRARTKTWGRLTA